MTATARLLLRGALLVGCAGVAAACASTPFAAKDAPQTGAASGIRVVPHQRITHSTGRVERRDAPGPQRHAAHAGGPHALADLDAPGRAPTPRDGRGASADVPARAARSERPPPGGVLLPLHIRERAGIIDIAYGAPEQPQASVPPRIEIRNGNGVAGMARRVGTMLDGHGLSVVRLSNEPGFGTRRTVIRFSTGHETAARAIGRLLPVPVLIEPTGHGARQAAIRIVLGHDLAGPPVGRPATRLAPMAAVRAPDPTR